MIIRLKEGVGNRSNYIEVDLSEIELENIKKGRCPSGFADVNGKNYCISVGLKR